MTTDELFLRGTLVLRDYYIVSTQRCGDCQLACVTPGDYLCVDCRIEMGCEEVTWWIDSHVCRPMYLLTRHEGWVYLADMQQGTVVQVRPIDITDKRFRHSKPIGQGGP